MTMISFIQSHTSGNAIRILLTPPVGSVSWKLLRKTADTFTGATDPGAITVFDGNQRNILDTVGLVNGELAYYRAYYFDALGALISTSTTKSATPSATFIIGTEDGGSIVRDRLDLGLQALLARGMISHPRNLIPVLIASPLIEESLLPLVTVHVSSDSPEAQFVGGFTGIDDDENPSIGWLSRYQLEIIGWSLNSDQRKVLRNAIKHTLIANTDVFDNFGFESIDLQFSDHEDFQTYNTPIFTTNCTMRFLAPSLVDTPIDGVAITNFVSTITV